MALDEDALFCKVQVFGILTHIVQVEEKEKIMRMMIQGFQYVQTTNEKCCPLLSEKLVISHSK